jgi:hypothetical protein
VVEAADEQASLGEWMDMGREQAWRRRTGEGQSEVGQTGGGRIVVPVEDALAYS